jgi:hypothetical protein
MMDLRLIWLTRASIEKATILRQRERCRELVSFRGVQVSQRLLERDGLERRDDGGPGVLQGPVRGPRVGAGT